jgi:hypothetical protein
MDETGGPSVAPVVVEDQGELVRALPKRRQRPQIRRRPSVHEHQRMSASEDVDDQTDVANGRFSLA